MEEKPIQANKVATEKGQTIYPEPFASQVQGRTKRKLGNLFGLINFGVNLTHLEHLGLVFSLQRPASSFQ